MTFGAHMIWCLHIHFVCDRLFACCATRNHPTYSLAVVNHIIPALGHYTIEELTEQKIQEMALIWLERGRCDGGGGFHVKPSTIDAIRLMS